MIDINTGRNVVDTAMQIIDNKLQQQPARDVVETGSKPPKPPAYVQRRRRLLKRRKTSRQMQLGI